MPRWTKIILLILQVCFLSRALSAQEFGRNKVQRKNFEWQILVTPHFDIHFYKGEENFAMRAGLVLEDGYEMLSRKLGRELPWKVPIILYASHNDFLQTNVLTSLLPEGVQAFAEPSRKRIVLPFTGSFKSFQHTAIHELAHVFTFNIVYNRLLDNIFSRSYLFTLPLWLVEGLAEYLSIGWDVDSDMFIRDAVIYDYLLDLDVAGGFYVYKEGQSVLNYIANTYGREKILEILTSLGSTRSANSALENTIGLNTRELSRKWKKALRKHYWPMYANKQDVEELGRQLTNHVQEHGYYNTKPVFSPDGDRIAFFSDRDGLISIYVMSSLEGKIIKKLVSGQRSNRFESLHAYTSSISFSPDGKKIVFIAKARGRDVLYIMDSEKGKVIKKIDIHADALAAPDWSPMGNEIVLSAILHGQTDLIVVDVEKGSYKRLTNDADDQLTPKFFPDGKNVIFTYYPEVTIETPTFLDGEGVKFLREMDFLAPGNVNRDISLDLYMMDLETGSVRPVVATRGDDAAALILKDGKTALFTSDESGISNLYAVNVETGEYHRITNVLGGLFTPDVNEEKGRLTFSAFVNGGWDIFVTDDLYEVMKRNYSNVVDSTETAENKGQEEPSGEPHEAFLNASLKRNSLKGLGSKALIAHGALPMDIGEDSTANASYDSLRSKEPKHDKPGRGLSYSRQNDKSRLWGESFKPDSLIEGLQTPVKKSEVETKGGIVTAYKARLSPDFIGQGAGLYFSTGLGFGLSNTIALSDILGNHRLLFSFNFFRDIEDSDFLASYFYLRKHIDYGFGIFQFKNFLNSRVSTIGEDFLDYRLFTERNYGVFALVSIPFNTFYRMDLEFQGFVSDREFFSDVYIDPETNEFFVSVPERSRKRLIEPTISFVHDASFFSYFGPVEGSRWIVSFSKGLAFEGDDVSRSTGFLDYRWYKRLFYRNSLAFRVALAASEGTEPRSFFLGGPVTLRGYDYLAFQGTRIALVNLEYRYPMIDAFILGWPTRWGFRNIGGTLFFDAGAAWDKDDITPLKKDVNRLQFQDIHADFGFGTYLNIGFLLLNFQFAWQTDLHSIGDSQFHFFLGPAF